MVHTISVHSHHCAWRNVGSAQYRCTLVWPTPKIPSVENIPPITVDQNVRRSVGSMLKLQNNATSHRQIQVATRSQTPNCNNYLITSCLFYIIINIWKPRINTDQSINQSITTVCTAPLHSPEREGLTIKSTRPKQYDKKQIRNKT